MYGCRSVAFLVMSLRIPCILLGAVALAAGGCSVSAVGPSSGSPENTVINSGFASDAGAEASFGGSSSGGGGVERDAAAPGAYLGSPLCRAPATANQGPANLVSCDPDAPTTALQCNLAPDGGTYNPDAVLACRVQPAAPSISGPSAVSTVCSAVGPRPDGNACTESIQCGAASDCAGPSGASSCRNYCCAGNAQCAGGSFCDVQPLAQASGTRVPVCMPITPAGGCSLLQQLQVPATACGTGATCSVVREDGSTACIEAGAAKARDACDTGHCGPGLVCLGATGARTCYALCHTSSANECVAPQTCQGGLPLFQDPTVGVCR